MKQYEAVIEVMEKYGGMATLGLLYKEVPKIPDCKWNTKTPMASIRRIVQDDRFFFKIKPGLWALLKYRQLIENQLEKKGCSDGPDNFNHSYFQGLIIEIGNLYGMQTYLPPQDRNKLFLSRPLKEYATIQEILPFTYENIVKRAKTVDVIWFNSRHFPSSFFEIEHTTDMQNSLLKFVDLQDFYSKFYIVSDVVRKNEFSQKINFTAFSDIKDRITFVDYDYIANLHTKAYEFYHHQKAVSL